MTSCEDHPWISVPAASAASPAAMPSTAAGESAVIASAAVASFGNLAGSHSAIWQDSIPVLFPLRNGFKELRHDGME
ncbi:MAG: hypothetical protein IJ926_02990, partial [Firmicutes bacterium]|nr:hypothetical protein [Bacillota bacterium]